jgi:hypothetical protein
MTAEAAKTPFTDPKGYDSCIRCGKSVYVVYVLLGGLCFECYEERKVEALKQREKDLEAYHGCT